MQRLRELRHNLNKKQKEIAQELNLSVQVYCNYENGLREPSFDTLTKLADYFDVSVDYLLGRTENKETVSTENLFKTKKAPESLSDDEQELLKQYNLLDSHSKTALLELAKNLNINKSKTERKIK